MHNPIHLQLAAPTLPQACCNTGRYTCRGTVYMSAVHASLSCIWLPLVSRWAEGKRQPQERLWAIVVI